MSPGIAAGPAAAAAAAGSRRWAMLALLALGQVLGMSLWFTATAVSPQLAAQWGLDSQQAGWLTTVVQLGFVAGTAIAAVLNLADVLPVRPYFAACALLAAAANALLLAAPGYGAALALRFISGAALAGVYPPAMKMAATWFRSGRGLAIGVIVGALTAGKATPYLIGALGGASPGVVLLSASAAAAAAALLVGVFYRDGPHPFARRPFQWALVGAVLRDRGNRLVLGGYLGHMWELYAMWSLLALFFYDFFQSRGATALEAGARSGLVAFAAIAMGALGSVLAGHWADRLGRERTTIWSMIVSGSCALVIGWLTFLPAPVLIGLALVWGFAIVADSAQFSALVTEVAPGHAVGTALTLQVSLGFLLTAFSIWLTHVVAEGYGWGLAFSLLALGPALGIRAMSRLQRDRLASRL